MGIDFLHTETCVTLSLTSWPVNYLIVHRQRTTVGRSSIVIDTEKLVLMVYLALYIFATSCGIATLLVSFVAIVRSRLKPWARYSTLNLDLPNASDLNVPHECANAQGDLNFCTRKGAPCYGKWKPLTAHHCSTCGVCQVGFDHHCPWVSYSSVFPPLWAHFKPKVGTCVTEPLKPAFLSVLLLTPAVTVLGICPVVSVLFARFQKALALSHATPWIEDRWWSSWYSWILVGGPFGRWGIGAGLGLREILKQEATSFYHTYPGYAIEHADLGIFVVVFFAMLLSSFAMVSITGLVHLVTTNDFEKVMALATARDISNGKNTLDGVRTKKNRSGRTHCRYLCLPSNGDRGKCVLELDPEDRLYDLGIIENWRSFLRLAMDSSEHGR